MANTPNYSPEDIARFYFTRGEDIKGPSTRKKDKGQEVVLGAIWTCKCGNKRKKLERGGWTNLEEHVLKQHPNYLCEMPSVIDKTSRMKDYYVDAKTANLFGWIEWILSENLPFTFCEKKMTRKYSNLSPLSVKTLKKYMLLLASYVEKKIVTQELPNKFGLVYDGWTNKSTHFIALFAIYKCQNTKETKQVLLAFSPMFVETDFSAENHEAFINDTLDSYGKSLDNVLFYTCDNCSTNKKTANLSHVPMIGCASHRFNLAVEKCLVPYMPLLTGLHELMKVI